MLETYTIMLTIFLKTLNQIKAEDYIGNIRILGNSFWSKRVLSLRAPKDAFSGEALDNAAYSPLFNQVQIYLGLIKGSGIGYSKDLPRALMYGGFTSSTLGHELTHGLITKAGSIMKMGISETGGTSSQRKNTMQKSSAWWNSMTRLHLT